MAAPPAGFDPEAATAAYLRAHAAECRVLDCVPDYSPWVFVVLPAITLLAIWLFLATGASARLRDLTARVTHRSWLQESLFGMALALLVCLVQFPFRYWLERVVGAYARMHMMIRDEAGNMVEVGGAQTSLDWVLDRLTAVGTAVLLAAFAMPYAMNLIRRLPRWYWVLPAAVATLWMVSLDIATTRAITVRPLPAGPLGEDIATMARASGQSPDRILLGQLDPFHGVLLDARVVWWNGRPHAIIDQSLFNIFPFSPEAYKPPLRPTTAAEVRAILGHELAHLQLGYLFYRLVILFGLTWLLSWLAFVGSRRMVHSMGARWRITDVTDLAAFPGIVLMFGLAFCAFFPLTSASQLIAERRADAVGLDIAREPDGVAAFALREAQGRRIRYSFAEQWLFFTHPSPEHRIRRAMEWKARNAPARWRATGLSGPVRVETDTRRRRPPIDKKPPTPAGNNSRP
jgi:STE24 endopeptidase